ESAALLSLLKRQQERAAKDKEAAKRHIMKRARALKLESLIPANWLAGTSEKSEKEVDDASFMASLVEFQLLEDQIDK
ncbi:MAG: hypothetical protein EB023_13510, partial [Flavobacteriia bacterium]|nr:hypothetical protein [Flavobacteriia bacterium]